MSLSSNLSGSLRRRERGMSEHTRAAREPADLYQEAEERLCQCGAAGSGEWHAEWCPWVGSKWHRWAQSLEAKEERDE
jgi:hypothetical protein